MFLLKQGPQIRVGHEKQVGEAGSEESTIDISKLFLGVVYISASGTVNLDTRQLAISTHTNGNDILILAHDSGTVAELACQVALSDQSEAQGSLNISRMNQPI